MWCIQSLHRWLPTWSSLEHVRFLGGAKEIFSVGVYAYIRLPSKSGREPALLLEMKVLDDTRQLCLLAWLYRTSTSKAVCDHAGAVWSGHQVFILSTHLQVVDCDTLDSLLETDLFPCQDFILDVEHGTVGERQNPNTKLSWLFAMLRRESRSGSTCNRDNQQRSSQASHAKSLSTTIEVARSVGVVSTSVDLSTMAEPQLEAIAPANQLNHTHVKSRQRRSLGLCYSPPALDTQASYTVRWQT